MKIVYTKILNSSIAGPGDVLEIDAEDSEVEELIKIVKKIEKNLNNEE